jgi:hypothetical protein
MAPQPLAAMRTTPGDFMTVAGPTLAASSMGPAGRTAADPTGVVVTVTELRLLGMTIVMLDVQWTARCRVAYHT